MDKTYCPLWCPLKTSECDFKCEKENLKKIEKKEYGAYKKISSERKHKFMFRQTSIYSEKNF